MAATFSVNEIFDIAEEIERNGARLYRKAAESASSEEGCEFFQSLAAMEDGHLGTFQSMRKHLMAGKVETYDPQGQAYLYLKAIADLRGYEGKKNLVQELTGRESRKEILEIALNAEKESVFLYYGMKDLLPSADDRETVSKIIKEELSHITLLLTELKSL